MLVMKESTPDWNTVVFLKAARFALMSNCTALSTAESSANCIHGCSSNSEIVALLDAFFWKHLWRKSKRFGEHLVNCLFL